MVRPAAPGDWPAVSGLVKDLDSSVSLLQDLDHFYTTGSDPVSAPTPESTEASKSGTNLTPARLVFCDKILFKYLRAVRTFAFFFFCLLGVRPFSIITKYNIHIQHTKHSGKSLRFNP